MKKNIATILTVLVLQFVYIEAFSQKDKTPDFIEKDLDAYVIKAIEKWNIPGLALAIVKDGKVVKIQGYGVLESGKKEKVDKNTLFMIASNTKAFVGTSLALLEYENKCNLDDSVIKWVPGFQMNNPIFTSEVTITDLLTHRLGTKTFQGDFMYFYSNLTKRDVYSKFPKVNPMYHFRAKYGYSNVGYFWAGECIEAISGMSWDQYVQMKLIKPLEMSNTLLLSKDISLRKNVAAAHTLQDGKLKAFPHTNIDVIGPAASICSSVEDLSHWLIAQTDSGRYKGKEIIPYKVIDNTLQPRTFQYRANHSFNNTNYSLYGLGWSLQDYEDVEVVSHSGGILGFVTAVALVPKQNLGIVILTNSDENWLYEALKWEIIDAYLDLPYRNYSDKYNNYFIYSQMIKYNRIKELKDSISLSKGPEIDLSAFEGKYSNKMYGNLEIKKDRKKLMIIFEHHPDLEATLEHLTDNRFVCTYYPSRMGVHVFPFTIEDGKVKGFELNVADRLENTSYDFVKVE